MRIYSLNFMVFCAFSVVMNASVIRLDDCPLSAIMQQYTTTNHWHAGDLYEHSVWVAKVIEKWFDERNDWVDNLDAADKRVLIYAGFLHDIGKAGDLDFIYYDKPSHPIDGMHYLMGYKNFYCAPHQSFDFALWFAQHAISVEDQRLIAALVGTHWDFGGEVLREIKNGKNKKKAFDRYLFRLKTIVQKTGYNNGELDERFVRMAILLNAADVQGTQLIDYDGALFEVPNCAAQRCCCNHYEDLDFEGFGKQIRQEILHYFVNS